MRRPSFELLPNHATELPDLRRGQIALLGFRVGLHHVERLIFRCPVIDDSQPTAPAGPRGCPANVAQAPGLLDDRSLLWAQHQRDLQLAIPFVVEMSINCGREHRRFDGEAYALPGRRKEIDTPFRTKVRSDCVMKKRTRRSFSAAYKSEVVDLVRASAKSIGAVAKDLDLTETAVRAWVRQASVDGGHGPVGALTTAERDELTQLPPP